MAGYVYGASESVAYVDGVRVVVHTDEPWRADDPIVKARPDLFNDDPADPRGTVEQATAEPGETRNTGRKPARKKSAAKSDK